MDQAPAITRSLVAALLLAAPAARLAAQEPAPPGTVTGIVFDSLLNAPLAGARVWVDGSTITTTTDARGRFRLEGVPVGRPLIAFEHPDLDSIGLTQHARRAVVAPGSTVALQLAVPSLPTLVRRLCGAEMADLAPAGLGILFGSVTDAQRGSRLTGARVDISWLSVMWSPGAAIEVARSNNEVRSDSLGNYYQCAMPLEQALSVAAAVGPYASGRVDVFIGERGIMRRDLAVGRDSASLELDSTGLRRGRATIAGEVRDDAGRPVTTAQAVVDDAAGDAMVNDRGTFVLGRLPAGTQMLTLRAIGYGMVRVPVDLRSGDTVRVRATLQMLTALDTIRVMAAGNPIVAEMTQRLRSGYGTVLTGAQVRAGPSLASALTVLPSLTVDQIGGTVRLTGRSAGRLCTPVVWLDGWLAPGGADMLRSIQPRQVIAVEWYARGWQAPPRYQPMGGDCGVLLVWTTSTRS